MSAGNQAGLMAPASHKQLGKLISLPGHHIAAVRLGQAEINGERLRRTNAWQT